MGAGDIHAAAALPPVSHWAALGRAVHGAGGAEESIDGPIGARRPLTEGPRCWHSPLPQSPAHPASPASFSSDPLTDPFPLRFPFAKATSSLQLFPH